MRSLLLSALCLLLGGGLGWAQGNGPAAKPKPLAPLVLYPACPCYHAVGEGNGETRIDALVNLNPVRRVGAKLQIQITDANGNAIQTASVDVTAGGIVGANVRIRVQAAAAFRVMARLMDGAGKQIAKAATDIHVVPREEARVQFGPDGFLRIGGKAEFPVGLYSGIRYDELGRVGFTATHNYEITTGLASEPINHNDAHLKELLDKAWAAGMRMMVEIPRDAVEKAQFTQVRRRVETFRHHPGLLCWDSEERVDRGKAPLANIAALYQLIHALDPDHPFVLGDSRDVNKKMLTNRSTFFAEADMDAGIWWWYPIPLGKKEPLLEPPTWLTKTVCKKPLWIAIQSYKQPWLHSRFPTPAEYRAMAYLSIINGVKGLWFYTGSGERDYYHKPAGVLNQPEEGHWDYVQTLIHELRDFSPVIMAPAAGMKLAMSPADASIESAVRELDGKFYLIAASKSPQPQAVHFTGSALAGHQAQVLFETHPVTIEGDSLADNFEPFGVHIYKIE